MRHSHVPLRLVFLQPFANPWSHVVAHFREEVVFDVVAEAEVQSIQYRVAAQAHGIIQWIVRSRLRAQEVVVRMYPCPRALAVMNGISTVNTASGPETSARAAHKARQTNTWAMACLRLKPLNCFRCLAWIHSTSWAWKVKE